MVHSLTALLTSVGAFLLILTVVVTIHEMGHFLVAKGFNVAIDRFAIGFGRPIFRRVDRSGVEWRLGWLPVGGYVRFSGDADASSSVPAAEDLDDLRQQIERKLGPEAVSRFFHFKPLWQRALVVAAGPFANFALSIALFAILVSVIGMNTLIPRIGAVQPGAPAAAAGLAAGDVITQLDGHPIRDFKEIGDYVHMRSGEAINVVYQRGPDIRTAVVIPKRVTLRDELTGRSAEMGVLGVLSSRDPRDYRRVQLNPVQALGWGAEQTWGVISTTVAYIGRIVTGKESANQLSSFLGMAQTAGAVAKAGADSAPDLMGKTLGVAINLLSLAALISTGVGFMNLLPIPVLDGGHLLFYGYEAIARRPVGARIQAASYRIGLALLLGLMLFATWNDLQQRSVFKLLGFSS